MSNKAKFGYLAGIIDGEGCITIGAGRKETCTNYNSIIMVTNTNKKIIDWLQQQFGGNYYKIPASGNCKEAYRWRFLKQKEIEKLLLAILPYLIIKREQAIVLLEFVRMSKETASQKREELFQKMKALNKRGISVTTNTQDTAEEAVKIESELHSDMQSEPMVTLVS